MDCPVFIFAGKHDDETPSALAIDWLAALHAPRKGLVRFDNPAHMMELTKKKPAGYRAAGFSRESNRAGARRVVSSDRDARCDGR
jgi:pimeloyl-ACP methyl ester carboxylesterase